MKKYCLTECFKRKMSNGWKNCIHVAIGIGFAIAIVSVASILGAIVGYPMTYFFPGLFNESAHPVSAGLGVIVVTSIIGAILYWIFLFISAMTKKVSKFVIARYEGEPFQCKIFEECKEEENVNGKKDNER